MASNAAFVPLSMLHNGAAASPASSDMRVAIVCMPWGSIQKPSLAMGILKRLIADAGFTPDLHYLNFKLAAQIGLKAYEDIAGGAFFYQEWFFSQYLFGADGTGEMQNRWEQMLADHDAGSMLRGMTGHSTDRDEYFKFLAESEVPRFLDAAFQQVDWQRYKIVGFTTTFAQSLASLAIAKRIKAAYPEIAIVFGGANVDSEMGNEFVRAFPWIDHAVHGEAEYTFPHLLSVLSRGDKIVRIPGISSRNGDAVFDGHLEAGAAVDINHSPAPDYTDYVAAIEANGFKGAFKLQLFYESSRGCWWGEKHHCTFCGLNGGTMKFRQKQPDKVLTEILNLSREYHCLSLSATDNILSNQSWATFLPQLASMDLDIGLFYEVKANLSFEQLATLKSAGVREIQPGIESFSTRVLKLMDKGITGIQNIQLLKWCYEFGIRPVWNILYGFPGENGADYAEMADLVRSISHLYPPDDMPQVMYERFSPYHYDSGAYGINLRPAREYEYIFPRQRVALDRIAYFFEDSDPHNSELARARIHPVVAEVEQWRKSWETQNRYLFYEKGPGFLHIYDNRPRDGSGLQEARLMKLGGQLGEVYQFCDKIRSKRSIIERFGDGEDESSSRNQSLAKALDALTLQGLLHVERERYLALAVRKKSRQFWPDKY
jgi:ribosomal peptide maturation radical SAM protein 1